MIDVNSISFSENIILTNIVQAFSWLEVYSNHILYYFISFEIVLTGIGLAFFEYLILERLFFQVLKIGLIIFFIQHYGVLLNSILTSTITLGQHFTNHAEAAVLFNPGLLWQYGYDHAIYLLQTATTMDGFALPLLLISLAMGILLVFGIFGIQVCLQVISFYCVATLTLITLPLSCFQPLNNFFSHAIQGVLQAAFRLIVQMLLVYSAVHVWSICENKTSITHLNLYLGLLFTGLLFVMASFYLPSLAAKLIGEVQASYTENAVIQKQCAASTSSSSSAQALSSSQTMLPIFIAGTNQFSEKLATVSVNTMSQMQYQVRTIDHKRKDEAHISVAKQLEDINKERLREIQEIKKAFMQAFNDCDQLSDK